MKRSLIAAVSLTLMAACSPAVENPQPVENNAEKPSVLNIYSARHYDSDKAMYDAFEAETGIKVRVRESGAAELLETMKAEGELSPADMIIASDAGTLYRFQAAGLTQALHSATLEAAIPAQFRETDGHWVGLAKRVRVIVYDPAQVAEDQVDEYADLAAPAFADNICMRSSTNIYNLSLMGELIGRWGAEAAEEWASAVVANFARKPQGGDTAQIQSIAAGECAAALVNHYYWVRLSQGSDAQKAMTAATRLSFPDQSAGGTHVNITGAALAAHAGNRENAVRFIEWLTTPAGQAMLVTETKEFPIVAEATLPVGLEQLPEFVESTFPLNQLGENQNEAQAIYDRAGWN